MRTAEGRLVEIFLDGGGKILCPVDILPAPGQYLQASSDPTNLIIPVSIFMGQVIPGGFLAAPRLPAAWTPGSRLNLRGPLGKGFHMPTSARHVTLIAFDESPERIRGLIPIALGQKAEVVVLSEHSALELPEAVEVLPFSALNEVQSWADYLAMDVDRDRWPRLRNELDAFIKSASRCEAQVLIHAPMPCGALAECGVCAITMRDGWKMACKDGPVFDLRELV